MGVARVDARVDLRTRTNEQANERTDRLAETCTPKSPMLTQLRQKSKVATVHECKRILCFIEHRAGLYQRKGGGF